MTCSFLETASLRSLIAPVTEEEFRTRYWEQKPLVVHRGDPDYYGDLFTLQDFDDALTRTPKYVKVADATKKNYNKPINITTSTTTKDYEDIFASMRDGSTLILDGLHRQDPKLAKFCRLLGPEFGHRFQTNLYLTPPNGKGFTPHWDNHDVFIIQVVGSKLWHLEKQRRAFPTKNDSIGDEGRELRGEVDTFKLNQGDLIYIPRGFIHAAECGAEPSLHITLGVTAIFLETLLYTTVKAAIDRDERLRVALPLGFMRGDQRGVVKQLADSFRDLTDEKFLSEVLDKFRDTLVSSFPLDVSGQISDFFLPQPLTVETVVGPRAGIVYQMHDENDTVRLYFGARSIVFPSFFGEALKFALNNAQYRVGELPGDLEDEERVVFVERLMQEGLTTRK